MNAENYFISLFASTSGAVGDDGALLGKYVYSKDAFFENVHFKRSWMTLEQIAYKAMIVNISDAYAMNAVPRYALLAVAMPKRMSTSDMQALHRGFDRAAKEHGIEIIGGDTIANVKLDISVTIISECYRPLLRSGLKRGHLLAYTGRLGRSRRELRYLMNGGVVHDRSKFVASQLRHAFVEKATPSLSCGMDISDGLFSDLEKLADANRLGFKFDKPVSKCIGCSGEEYEMLIGFDPRQRKRVKRIAQKLRVPLTIVAKAKRGRFKNRCKAHHF
ncbi:MAG: thiamine-phosphate kinase [Sulfurimonadaceae bacterium]|nr:thiamine-phosphate kinase [Sulfurimonadaceae bacterium]